MKYIFIVNGRKDKEFILPDLESQLSSVQEEYEIYITKGRGDATRYVRLYCEFNEKDEVCFVACGGSGTMNEVASGLVCAQINKSMAFLAYGTTNDYTKSFPSLNFTSVKAMIEGQSSKIDVIKCNDDYAINVINIGFDAMAGYYADEMVQDGVKGAYNKAVTKALFGSRYNRLKILVDGEKISGAFTLLCCVCNASYCGGQFYCSPDSKVDDGTIEVIFFPSCALLTLLMMLPKYKAGLHLQDDFCRTRLLFKRCKHIEVSCKELMYVCLDGEIVGAKHFDIDVLPSALNFRYPKA